MSVLWNRLFLWLRLRLRYLEIHRLQFVAQYSGQSNRTEEDLENKKAETELIKARKESITGENENNDALDRLDQILKEVRDNAFKQETE